MAVVLALDAGTTGVRSLAVDEHGHPVRIAYREFTQHFPRPGWVEHDAAEIWEKLAATLAEVAGQLDEPIAAIGITNQRETLVAWDRRTGEPRHRAIVWQDRRTAGRCDQLGAAGHLEQVRATTGLVLDPYFSGTKAEWLLTEGGVAADEHLALGTVDAYLLWKLTAGAEFATEPSNASRTMLFDIGAMEWSPAMCDLLGVPMSSLPEVRPSCGRLGTTADGLAVPAGIPISGILGDQQAALFGQACVREGMTKNTYGTGSFVLMNVGGRCPEPVDGLLTTVGWELADGTVAYALEGSVFVTGAAIQWLRDGLGVISAAPEIGPLAASVDSSGGVYFVPALTGLGSPWWDPYARGTIVGLTRGTGRGELARATIESIAYQTRDVVAAMTGAAGVPLATMRVDGGAAVMDLLLQIQADQLRIPVSRPVNTETTAAGAAFIAGLAEGVWSSVDDIERTWELDVEFTPSISAEDADATYSRWLRAVERSRAWAEE